MPGALSAFSLARAEELSAQWKGTNFLGGTTKNLIDGEFRESKMETWIDVLDPATQMLLYRVPETILEEFESAGNAAARAFPRRRATWTPLRPRSCLSTDAKGDVRHPHDAHGREDRGRQGKTGKVLLGHRAVQLPHHDRPLDDPPRARHGHPERDPGATMIIAEASPPARSTSSTTPSPRQRPLHPPPHRRAQFCRRGTKNGTRVQCNMGAKNHAAVMPDANRDQRQAV
ncbi:hypothetical protein K438DRAFT_1785763 [Mycena galopus ATCC 62051]|nr:hypothetical protein K438DRAFT_1785763 [Mycena galopus ATCC 62051]